MDLQQLETLVRRGEIAKVELKEEYRLDVGAHDYRDRKRSDLAWDIAAIANTRGGTGYLLIGIDERTGAPSATGPAGITADQIHSIVTARCDPPIEVEVETVRWSAGQLVLVITIPRSDRKPHTVRERGTPVRRGATTAHASHNELIEMAQDTGSADFGRSLVRVSWRDALDRPLVAAFLAAQGQPVDVAQPDEGVLAGHGILRHEDGTAYPTAAAILLFGRRPQSHFSHATLSLFRFRDAATPDTLDSDIATGTLLNQLRRAEAFVGRNLAGAYPIEVVREAVVNALIHRDYRQDNAECSVRLVGDVLEVISPGVLIGGLELEDVAQGAVSQPPRRNQALVNLLFDLSRRPGAATEPAALGPVIERAGSGIRRMRERLSERGLPLPQFSEDEARRLFVVTLRDVPVVSHASGRLAAPALNPRQQRLLAELAPDDTMSAAEYEARFRVSRKTATDDLRGLIDAKMVDAVGRGTARRYRRR